MAAAIVALRAGALPPDAEHPYGHHEAEYLSAVPVATMIVAASVAIRRDSCHGFLDPKPVVPARAGLGGSGVAAAGLLVEAIPDADRDRIGTVMARESGGAIQAQALRTRNAGKATYIDFHLVVPKSMTVERSQGICDRLEAHRPGDQGMAKDALTGARSFRGNCPAV